MTIPETLFMVYMGGDNGTILSSLESEGEKDLKEMKEVGSTKKLRVVAQFDRMSDHRTRRYYIRKSTTLEEDMVDDLGETNTGDRQVLIDFVIWAMTSYPSKNNILVLWNHGSGVKDDSPYRSNTTVDQPPSREISIDTVESTMETEHNSSRNTNTRAILFDDSAKDFLDNQELAYVLKTVTEQTGKKIDILGFDACLMNCLEIAYQVKDYVSFIVGSQEVEPGAGWPYNKDLVSLLTEPDMASYSKKLVENYYASYDRPITQSALQLDKIDSLASSVSNFALWMQDGLYTPSIKTLLSRARFGVQRFEDREYIDLYDFADLISKETFSPIKDYVEHIKYGVNEFVISNKSHSYRAHGVSIYFPTEAISPLYATLDFSKSFSWFSFLQEYLK